MQRQFLLLWALCALATALPQDKKPVETESEEPKKWDSNSTTTLLDLLSPSPTKSSPITSTTSPATNTPLTTTTAATSTTTTLPKSTTTLSPTTSSITNPPLTTTTAAASTTTYPITTTLSTTTLSTTTSSTTNPPLSTTTVATTSTTLATSTTAKPESKVINIKHAEDLTATISKAGDKLVVIFVMTTWCPFSIRVVPTVEDVARSTENMIMLKVVYNKVDTSEDWKYGVTSVSGFPSFIFLKKGTKLEDYASSNAERLKRKVIDNMIRRVE